MHPNHDPTVVVQKGQSIDLDCSAAGAPSPNYTWTVPPDSSAAQGPVNQRPILSISLVDTADAGMYSCVVDNGIGQLMRVFNLTVIGKIDIVPARVSVERFAW